MVDTIEQFQDACLRIFNPKIRRHFRDVQESTETGRAQLRKILLHEDKDGLILTVGRLIVYLILKIEELIEFVALGVSDEPHEALPLYHRKDKAANHPKIVLFFSASKNSTPENKFALSAVGSFRVMECINFRKVDTTEVVVSEVILRKYANRIKENFLGYDFTKGDRLYIYEDPEHGFFGSKIYTFNKTTAADYFKRLCRIAGNEFDIDLIKDSGYAYRKSTTRPTGKMTGYNNRQVGEHQFRPIGKVYFRSAWAEVGTNKPKVLVDTMDLLQNAFVVI